MSICMNCYCDREENKLYKDGANVRRYSEIEGFPVLNAWEVVPDCRREQKSFYGKARVLITEKGWYLLSYQTLVCAVFPNEKTGEMNVFKRYWMDYSATTMTHVNSFLSALNLRGLHKNQWVALKYNTLYYFANVFR